MPAVARSMFAQCAVRVSSECSSKPSGNYLYYPVDPVVGALTAVTLKSALEAATAKAALDTQERTSLREQLCSAQALAQSALANDFADAEEKTRLSEQLNAAREQVAAAEAKDIENKYVCESERYSKR